MASDMCQHCWRPATIGVHNDGCPIALDTPEAMKEWKRGYAVGWDDINIHWWQYGSYSKTFLLGHQAGKSAIDQLVDEVAQAHFSYHSSEF